MNIRAIAAAILAGTVTMFAWQSVSNAALPWHTMTMHEVSDSTAANIETIRRLAPSNGVYFSKYGALLAVRIAGDRSDRSTGAAMGPMLIAQFALDLVIAGLLWFLAGFLLDRSALGTAKAASAVGFTIVGLTEISNAIWFGFTPAWSAVNIADYTICLFLTGLAIGAVMQKLDPDGGVVVPEGQGYRTSGGRKTLAR